MYVCVTCQQQFEGKPFVCLIGSTLCPGCQAKEQRYPESDLLKLMEVFR